MILKRQEKMKSRAKKKVGDIRNSKGTRYWTYRERGDILRINLAPDFVFSVKMKKEG